MGSGLIRIAAAAAQDTKGKGKSGINKIASLVKSQKNMANAYPVKAKKKK